MGTRSQAPSPSSDASSSASVGLLRPASLQNESPRSFAPHTTDAGLERGYAALAHGAPVSVGPAGHPGGRAGAVALERLGQAGAVHPPRDGPARAEGLGARAITSHRRMRMNHDVLSDTPHSSAHALREAPESMSDT